MSVILNPYLNFKDVAREAMSFYHGVFGGELTMTTFGEGGLSQNDAERDLIMHAMLKTPNGLVLMGADVPSHMAYAPAAGFAVSLSGGHEDSAELNRYWDALIQGGNPTTLLAVAPWGDEFGMLTDRFGIDWLVNIAGAQAG